LPSTELLEQASPDSIDSSSIIPSVGSSIEVTKAVDLSRYVEPASIWSALDTQHVRLIRMSWLIKQWKSGRVLNRRQELPEEAFITLRELQQMYGKGNRDGVLPIIAISFCWLTPSHPDPDGKQLAIVAERLESEQGKYGKLFAEMGIFWDWLSLYQKDAQGNRTDAEVLGFQLLCRRPWICGMHIRV